MDKRTPSLREGVVGDDTTRPAVARVGTVQLDWSRPAYCPKRDQIDFRTPESSALRVGAGHQPKKRKALQNQEERECRALAGYILQVRATREVEAVSVPG